MNEIESKSKPRRAQGRKGLLSHQISVQQTQQSIPLILREEREEEKRGEGGGRQGGEQLLCSCARGKEREGEGMRGYLPQQLSTQKTKLPLELKIN